MVSRVRRTVRWACHGHEVHDLHLSAACGLVGKRCSWNLPNVHIDAAEDAAYFDGSCGGQWPFLQRGSGGKPL